ncbi:MAG: bifunctional phosphoglucose/phosphomannose isomerase [Bacteroidia bacterium]
MDMRSLVEGFPAQLDEAVKIGSNAVLRQPSSPIQNVLISGLGGSGIGGTIVSELVFGSCPVPVNVTKGYFIPSYINQHSLVIVSSYSGNTEETIACMEEAIRRNAHVVCITSGGTIAELAHKHNCSLITIPGGMPPRSCLGYSLSQLLFIFKGYHLITNDVAAEISSASKLLINERDAICREAETLAKMLHGKIPVIYSTTNNEGIAVRFRQQLNENAKVLCWHHVIPEMNHNELVGWAGGTEEYAVVIFRDKDEYERNNQRIQLNTDIIRRYTPYFTEVWSKGTTAIEKAVYFIHFGDWVSVYLADLRGVDAVEVNVINFLKGELAKK